MTSLGISETNLTDEQLRLVALKLRNYTVLSNELVYERKFSEYQNNYIDFLKKENEELRKNRVMFDRGTAFGVTLGAVAGTGLIVAVVEMIRNAFRE